MRRRIATVAAGAAVLLLVPATAPAAESAGVSGGVLQYVSGAATVDTVTLSAGPGTDTLLSESTSPSGDLGPACTVYAPATARCSGALSAVLETLDGDDTITLIAAGQGADVVDVRGGGGDTVDCGPGTDAIQFDIGPDVLINCDLPAPGLPDPVAPASLSGTPAVRIATADVRVDADGNAPLELACPATEFDGCAGRVLIDPALERPDAYAATGGRFGRGKFDVAPGKSAKVKVKLSASARDAIGLPKGRMARAARRGRRVKTVVTVAERGKKPVKKKVKLHR